MYRHGFWTVFFGLKSFITFVNFLFQLLGLILGPYKAFFNYKLWLFEFYHQLITHRIFPYTSALPIIY